MAGTHNVIGDDIGLQAGLFDDLRLLQSGGAGITVDALDEWRSKIDTIFDIDDAHRRVKPELFAVVDGLRASIDTAIAQLRRATDIYAREILKPDINSTSTGTDNLFRDLVENMLDDSENVLENVITTTQPVADGDNVGDGEIFVYDEEPIEKRDNNRIQDQDLVIQCTQDELQNNRTAGAEVFNIQSSVHGIGPNFPIAGSSGINRGENRLVNGDFEDGSGTFPAGWNQTTIIGTSQEPTTVFRGAGALTAVADGSAEILNIDQDQTTPGGRLFGSDTRKMAPLSVWFLSCQARHGGAFSGTVRLGLEGTAGPGYSAGATEEILLTSGNLTGAYQNFNAFVVVPKDINLVTDIRLQILWDGSPTATHALFLDDVIFTEMVVWADAALRVVGIPGADPFVAGPTRADLFRGSTARQAPGTTKIQDYMTLLTKRNAVNPDRKPDINVQLPHGVAATANYAESKAN